ncbi:C40 family peptidase [Kitasatospora paracochleata]|uniref:Cell wall-associated NlpC family hydrolase n=1 Tax=Kitasatospora paracochleata TaxID=58354 RepID=A0ABT1J4L8_9ACTN|nr:C40 family peptidase [Kitasatospora paracochleata]MCP2312383.1 cell wall-associated NlpC family hydrolase [Kitasatospora paracochleata]
MGSHRRPKPPNRARIAVVAATAGAASLAVPLAAHAEPGPTPGTAAGAAPGAATGSLEQVKAQVDALYEDAEASTEAYNKAREQQDRFQRDTAQLQDRIAGQQARINELRETLDGLAAAQYRSGGIDPTVRLMVSADPADYLARAAGTEQLTARQADALRRLRVEQLKLDADRAEATGRLAELDRAAADAGRRKDEVKAKLGQVERILNGLKAADRARVLGDGGAAASRGAARPQAYTGPATGRVRDVLAFAYAQLGKPYRWGATGPDSFDCSGLTLRAFAAGGVTLPRVSQDQFAGGRKIARDQVQPGDLVFYYSDLHHVGIYLGNGQLLHAPRTGKNVEIVPWDVMPYAGAVRY